MSSSSPSNRIESLDQFRGYTVAGMFLVNYIGGFEAIGRVAPILKHHNDYCSYADTIMPHFLFAVGFAFRLTFGRRAQEQGVSAAYWHMVKRLLGLALIAAVVYFPGKHFFNVWSEVEGNWRTVLGTALKRDWFQTLLHIAVTSLWVLPVIASPAWVRIAYMLLSGALHLVLSYAFNFAWTNTPPNGIDGGPLGFLTWAIPLLLGSLTCDAVLHANRSWGVVFKMGLASVVIMALGWQMSCLTRAYDVVPPAQGDKATKLAASPVWFPIEKLQGKPWQEVIAEPPFVPPPPDPTSKKAEGAPVLRQWNYWMMSQRAGTLSYLVFAGGLSIFVYAIFYVLCDLFPLRIGIFHTLGINALAGYILHSLTGGAVKAFTPGDAPLWYVVASFLVFFEITYLILRYLEKQKIFLKL